VQLNGEKVSRRKTVRFRDGAPLGSTHVEDLLIGSGQFVQVGADEGGIDEDEILFVQLLVARNLFDALARKSCSSPVLVLKRTRITNTLHESLRAGAVVHFEDMLVAFRAGASRSPGEEVWAYWGPPRLEMAFCNTSLFRWSSRRYPAEIAAAELKLSPTL